MKNIIDTDELLFNPINQPDDVTCVSACIAMLIDVDVDEVVRSFHDNYFVKNCVTAPEFLESVGIKTKKYYVSDWHTIQKDKFYILCVPSLRYQGGNHCIFLQNGDKSSYLFDPANGRDGKKHYVSGDALSENEVSLNSWMIEVEADIDDVMEWRKTNKTIKVTI